MMLPKNPTAVLSPSSRALSVLCSSTPITSPCPPWRRHPDTLSRRCAQQCRSYASVQGKSSSTDDLGWPTSPNPTPYEILGLARDAPYNKARFFQLAKLYHPDRHHQTSDDGIPHLTKIDRYRLVVAANEIISNKQKRRMYDLYGFGWDDQADPVARHRAADKAWRQEAGNASMNATWEDWERWQQQKDGKQTESHEAGFAAVAFFFLIVGTWGWATRVGTDSMSLIEMRDQKSDAISKELRKRQSETVCLNREGRVESFLRHREAEHAYDLPRHGVSANAGISNTDTRPHN